MGKSVPSKERRLLKIKNREPLRGRPTLVMGSVHQNCQGWTSGSKTICSCSGEGHGVLWSPPSVTIVPLSLGFASDTGHTGQVEGQPEVQ